MALRGRDFKRSRFSAPRERRASFAVGLLMSKPKPSAAAALRRLIAARSEGRRGRPAGGLGRLWKFVAATAGGLAAGAGAAHLLYTQGHKVG
ncbi:hypothetical protein ER13_00905, partial [Brevundimonas sp. EAKA]